MTDTQTTIVDTNSSLSDIVKPVVAGQARHIISGLGAALIAKGALDPGALGQFTEIFSGFAVYLIGAGWSWWQKIGYAKLVSDLERLKNSLHGS